MKRGKNAQLKLSFGMIFSIILIIFFVAFAFYAIKLFLGMKDEVVVSKFVDDLNDDIDDVWKSSQASQNVEYSLPSKVDYVCFMDTTKPAKSDSNNFYQDFKEYAFDEENLFIYPTDIGDSLTQFEIKHIDIGTITQSKNPYCLEKKKGRIKTVLKKNFGEDTVCIGDDCPSSSSGMTGSAISETICRNAENNGFCNTLDDEELYGPGAKEDCCSEEGYCC